MLYDSCSIRDVENFCQECSSSENSFYILSQCQLQPTVSSLAHFLIYSLTARANTMMIAGHMQKRRRKLQTKPQHFYHTNVSLFKNTENSYCTMQCKPTCGICCTNMLVGGVPIGSCKTGCGGDGDLYLPGIDCPPCIWRSSSSTVKARGGLGPMSSCSNSCTVRIAWVGRLCDRDLPAITMEGS